MQVDAEGLRHIDMRKGKAAQGIERLQARVKGLQPDLQNIWFNSSWSGLIYLTGFGWPFLGEHPGLAAYCNSRGYRGHVGALSARVGRRIAETPAVGGRFPSWGWLEAYC